MRSPNHLLAISRKNAPPSYPTGGCQPGLLAPAVEVHRPQIEVSRMPWRCRQSSYEAVDRGFGIISVRRPSASAYDLPVESSHIDVISRRDGPHVAF